MTLIFPDGWFIGDESKLSEAKLKDIRLSSKQTSLYNSRNEILRVLAQKFESFGYESKPSEAKLKDIRLSQKQTSLYNSRNEILRGLAQKAESLGYDDPRNCPETKERFKEVTNKYNEQIREINKQRINQNEKIMALIENGC